MQNAGSGLDEKRQIFSVSQAVNEIRFVLETAFRNVWVQGEISNLKVYSSGHCYFTLKDIDAQLSAVCFRLQLQSLRFVPEDGMEVVARGAPSVYPARGQLQLIVEYMEPVGEGALLRAFEELKKKLALEGLFEPTRKRRLPVLPRCVGVVTSPRGAAIQDILRVLQRRNDRVSVLLYPTLVQGEGAAAEIARGVRTLSEHPGVDVIIVGRGGGSLEDLWPFNEEAVARAVFASKKPVISAVGHETDFTICDLVADLRAPTPSAGAEMVSGRRDELYRSLASLERRLQQGFCLLLNRKRSHVQSLAGHRSFVNAEGRLRLYNQRLDELWERLVRSTSQRGALARQRARDVKRDLVPKLTILLERRRLKVDSLGKELEAFSPLAVLQRGYAIVTTPAGEIVRSPEQVGKGEAVGIRVAQGNFVARKES